MMGRAGPGFPYYDVPTGQTTSGLTMAFAVHLFVPIESPSSAVACVPQIRSHILGTVAASSPRKGCLKPSESGVLSVWR